MITNFFKPVARASTEAPGAAAAAPQAGAAAATPAAAPTLARRSPAATPAASPASAAVGTGFPAPDSSKKRKAAEADVSAAELKRAKKIVAQAKKAAKAKKEKPFACSAELLAWKKDGSLHSQLQSHNTEYLKGLCGDCNLKYGGAKYLLMSRLTEHAQEAVRREKWEAVESRASEDVAAASELLFAKVKTVEAATNLFARRFAKLSALPTAAARLETLIGMSRGHDALLLKAITGPSRGKYNGKYDEIGMELQSQVGELWGQFLHAEGASLSAAEWVAACKAVHENRPTEAYGFDSLAGAAQLRCDELDSSRAVSN